MGVSLHVYISKFQINIGAALANVAQWIECWPASQRVSGLIPSPGTILGCPPGP